jgi:amidohydrolase
VPALRGARLRSWLSRWLDDNETPLIAVRRHIHAHPELSGSEFETAELLAGKLRDAGLAPRPLIKGNGFVCDVGSGDRVVALRADLDALPVQDTKAVPYRSTVDGVCHACGHDVHSTVLLGAGLALARLDALVGLPGRVRLIFQPSEEQPPFGSLDVIDAGELDEVQTIYALHCLPQLDAGQIQTRTGPITAATDSLEVRLTGPGGHTARPHLTADLVLALSRIVAEVPQLLARRVDPRASLTMVFGAVHAGHAHNTIPMEGHARATVRVLRPEVWRDLPVIVPQLVHHVAAGSGVDVEVDYRPGVPPVINDPGATAIAVQAAAAALGQANVGEAEVSMGGEDFAFYAARVPATMYRLGVGRPGSPERPDIHHPGFDVDESAIGFGVRVFAHAALAALESDRHSA